MSATTAAAAAERQCNCQGFLAESAEQNVVLSYRDTHVMTTVVFGVEVPVEGRCQRHLGQEDFQCIGFTKSTSSRAMS
ncbi:hypothetical protein, partial [Klebsiella pneumoniae]|uniref:hypothetical protein n=1 Tax=Klebsiella pneumoniae TaxID=573 RepID=UPI0027311EEB